LLLNAQGQLALVHQTTVFGQCSVQRGNLTALGFIGKAKPLAT